MQTSSTKQPAKQAALSRQKKAEAKKADTVWLASDEDREGEASVIGGLGSAVAETLVRRYPVRQEFVGIQDTFGESGSSADLLKKYGLTAADIVAAAHKARET